MRYTCHVVVALCALAVLFGEPHGQGESGSIRKSLGRWLETRVIEPHCAPESLRFCDQEDVTGRPSPEPNETMRRWLAHWEANGEFRLSEHGIAARPPGFDLLPLARLLVRAGRSFTRGHTDLRVQSAEYCPLPMPKGREADARRFYIDVLGLSEVARPTGMTERPGLWFEGAGAKILVEVAGDAADPSTPPGLLVADLPALARRLKAAGVAVGDCKKTRSLSYVAIVDPFGNRLLLVQLNP